MVNVPYPQLSGHEITASREKSERAGYEVKPDGGPASVVFGSAKRHGLFLFDKSLSM